MNGKRNSHRTAWLIPSVLSVVMAFSACTLPKQRGFVLQDTLLHYATLIRWGHFGEAQFHQLDEPTELDYDALRNIKVTAYDVINTKLSEDGDRYDQWVEIRYYNELESIEHLFTEHEIWRYNDEAQIWRIDGSIPDFGLTASAAPTSSTEVTPKSP